MRRPRFILRYFHVSTLSWMGGRCYDDLDKAADDYIKIATQCRSSVSRIEIYDFGPEPTTGRYDEKYLLFVDEWSEDMKQEIANAARRRVEFVLGVFLSVGGAS